MSTNRMHTDHATGISRWRFCEWSGDSIGPAARRIDLHLDGEGCSILAPKARQTADL